jgi:XRE family transcriptional regulator, aerobic/anaerobic benzoate catabolism transcriptional regulator
MLGDAGDAAAYLHALGERVREERARRGMSRKALAKDSGVSQRYLALLESGTANASIALLRDVAAALGVTLETLVADGPPAAPELGTALDLLRRLPAPELRRANEVLAQQFGGILPSTRGGRIALVGLRGAGKTTLGEALAAALAVPFIELDREIERDGGGQVAAIFDLYGQPGFRRFERQALERMLAAHERFVLATGGGIVSERATYARLRAACFTVWIRATPAEHMSRVLAQGDTRPMGGSGEAMADLQRILASREPLYAEADAVLDTSGATAGESVAALARIVEGAA